MRELVQVILFVSGGITLLGIYAFLEFSRGVTKSEIERAHVIVNAVKNNFTRPSLTYWLNVYYLKLIDNFGIFIGASGSIFLVALITLFFL
jgi:hypothetical protein